QAHAGALHVAVARRKKICPAAYVINTRGTGVQQAAAQQCRAQAATAERGGRRSRMTSSQEYTTWEPAAA
ncbi:MAG TPA: hypothetical protein VGL95_08120, partial [Acetobacteraceae bacterium]